MFCPRCGKENKNTNIRCEGCNHQLIDESKYQEHPTTVVYLNADKASQSHITEKSLNTFKIIIMLIVAFMSGPPLIAGLIIGGIGTHGVINQNIKTIGYEKTTGKLLNKENCSISDYDEDSSCIGIYQYEVDGKSYTVESDITEDEIDIDQIVYYNPKNPSESLIKKSIWVPLIVAGLFALIFPAIEITIAVSIYKAIKRGYDQQQGVNRITI